MTWAAFLATITPESRLRIAPTPSGFLHAGNALNFLLVHQAAQSAGPPAKILLRIDDIDRERKRPEYVQDVFDLLRLLGIHWDEGPRDAGDFEKNWSQHLRPAAYHEALNALRERDLLFACRKSRKELAPFGEMYPEAFRGQGLSLDDPDVNWRVRTPPGFAPADFVVRRRDGLPAYQIASLVDDHLFKVTHLIRGMDLEPSTAAQRYLAQCLGWTDFLHAPVFHHPLLTDHEGGKLSKSAGAQSSPLSAGGFSVAEIERRIQDFTGGVKS